ncbi:early endosome antigen 1-like isoform X2 [Rhopilema esculentum]|uniref:early endosome antigen 1-like isoform X2 n=1 Tax=Rhopilema esculentum TaxID=499914 RepID=UPI0031CF04CA
MSERGSCKVFAPNIFNPTKCQNCYKPKEGHPSGPPQQSSGKIKRGISFPANRDQNTTTIKTVLKEGSLSVGTLNPGGNTVQTWVKRWYVLYSSGELEEFPIEDGEVMRNKSIGVIVLQDFIRMLDGHSEIGEENSVGLKSLKDGIYLKAANKVDFENWWKELSTFVPSPMKRAQSAGAANKPQLTGTKPWLNKTLSSPLSSSGIKPVTAKSPLSATTTDADNTQVDGLNSKISKLQLEVNKIPKLEEERRKLELEVNYWKEYVTNANSMKRSGSKMDTEKALNEARIQVIDLQDKMNEFEKEKRTLSLKVNEQEKKLREQTTKLEEANNMINKYIVNISDLKMQLVQRKDSRGDNRDKTDGPPATDVKPLSSIPEERGLGALSPTSDTSSERGETSDLENKFINLREKMKRIEKELFFKSKELEKANESRSKVAKYTRTLLQELEAKLNDTQRKMLEASERLSDTTMELEMERERRRRLESEIEQQSLSRHSSVSSSLSEQNSIDIPGETVPQNDTEVSNRYVDYYRSRFREAEGTLLEKDKKLSESQTKFRELEAKYRNVLKQCRSLDDIQVKLSDATHKLSDRQLKIHELTREVEKLRGYERGYDRKSKELQLSTDKVKDLEEQLSDLRKRFTVQEKELEGFKIREVVMKERLTAFEEESSDEEEEGDDADEDDAEARLERSIEAKARVEKTIDLEGQVRLLSNENTELTETLYNLESKLKAYEEENAGRPVLDAGEKQGAETQELENNELRERVKELEAKLIKEEDGYYSAISEMKEKHKSELNIIRSNTRQDMTQFAKLKEEHELLKNEINTKMLVESKDSEEKSKLIENVTELKQQVEDTGKRLSEQESRLVSGEERIRNLEAENRDLISEIGNKNILVVELTEKTKDTESALVSKSDTAEQLQKLHLEKDDLLKSLEKDNAKLREDFAAMENAMLFASGKKYEAEAQGRDGEIKEEGSEMLDTGIGLRVELNNLRDMLMKSQSLKMEYKNQLEEAARKYLESEQRVIELAENLDSRSGLEKGLKEEVMAIQIKMEAMRKQLIESQDLLQSKSIELEKERSNISHLVDVTSAYIKELENSLSESREKNMELQSIVEESKNNNGRRMPPEGIAEKDRYDSLSDQSDIEVSTKEKQIELERDRLLSENQHLNARILELESEISCLNRKFEDEKREIKELNAKQLQLAYAEKGFDEKDSCPYDLSQEDQALPERPAGVGRNRESQSSEDRDKEQVDRVQELQTELEQARERHDEEMKMKEESHAKLIEELRDDMEKSLADTIKAINSSMNGQNTNGLDERIIELEREKEELRVRYENELEAEKEAHQAEMEETIRDMLTVTEVFKSGKYNEKEDQEDGHGHTSQRSSRRSSVVSTDGLEEERREFEKKMAQKEKEYEKAVESVKKDMLTVIEAMQHGGASAAILELTSRNQNIQKELDAGLAEFEIEREDLKMKIERLESNNFFGLRRNEEMGTKIFQMQTELEEMERKHRLELEVYKDKENSDAILELVKVNEDLEKKIKVLEVELHDITEKHLEEMELLTMKVQEEKRVAICEMTDTVLSLEGVIDEMKDRHDIDIKEFEERSREEKLDAVEEIQKRIEELEILLSQTSDEYEERIGLITEEHDREMQELREELEAKVEYYKTIGGERQNVGKTNGHGGDSELEERCKELEMQYSEAEKAWQLKVKEMNVEFVKETEAKQQDFNNQINEIRSEYEEKLKSCIKESARRHSVSSRKTESQKNKELSSRVVELELALEEQQKQYLAETEDYKQIVNNFQALVSELRSGQPETVVESSEKEVGSETASISQDESKMARVQALENQIQGYEKRIDYYRKKAERDEEDENSRVSELQEEVHGLREEMKELTERHGSESAKVPETETKPVLRRRSETSDAAERVASARQQRQKRWSDLHLTDMVFTNDGVEPKKSTREREPWKRWSDLQLRQDPKLLSQIKKDDGTKSGSVANRKKLWENPGSGESRKPQRPLSSIRP